MSKNQAPFLLLLLLFFLRPNDPSFQEPSMVMDMTFWFSLSIYFIFDFLFYEPSRYSRNASLMAMVCLPHQTIRLWKVEWLSCIIRLGGCQSSSPLPLDLSLLDALTPRAVSNS